MIDDTMKSNRLIGMIQPKKTGILNKPDLYDVGCVGKITNFNETGDGKYFIIINGISRFKITKEISTEKLYRICKINYENFADDLIKKKEEINFSDHLYILHCPYNVCLTNFVIELWKTPI